MACGRGHSRTRIAHAPLQNGFHPALPLRWEKEEERWRKGRQKKRRNEKTDGREMLEERKRGENKKKKHEKWGTSNILTKNEMGLGFCRVYVGSTCGNHDRRWDEWEEEGRSGEEVMKVMRELDFDMVVLRISLVICEPTGLQESIACFTKMIARIVQNEYQLLQGHIQEFHFNRGGSYKTWLTPY